MAAWKFFREKFDASWLVPGTAPSGVPGARRLSFFFFAFLAVDAVAEARSSPWPIHGELLRIHASQGSWAEEQIGRFMVRLWWKMAHKNTEKVLLRF